MIISHEHKFILFCNPKTGSTSLEKTLEKYQEGEEFNQGIRQFSNASSSSMLFPNKHIPPLLLKAWLPQEIWDSYFKFVFVRNPWDWVVSEWKYHFKPRQVGVNDLIHHPVATARYIKHHRRIKALNSKKSFTQDDINYLFAHLKQFFPVIPNASGLYQSNYVFDLNGDRLVDFVGRFETIQDDFAAIKDKLGLDISLPHLNSTKRDTYKSYFTEDSKQRVAELWERDIANFDYSFDA